MTLNGNVDKEEFLREWRESEERDATYLQTEDAVFMMPYGNYSYSEETLSGLLNKKFSATYRRHLFVERDFEIKEDVLGGGYLILSGDEKSCYHGKNSKDFGKVPDRKAVEDLVNQEFFGIEN